MSDFISQEDLYYNTKASAEKILGVEITLEQWNEFFFKNINPIYADSVSYYEDVKEMRTALRALDNLKTKYLGPRKVTICKHCNKNHHSSYCEGN